MINTMGVDGLAEIKNKPINIFIWQNPIAATIE